MIKRVKPFDLRVGSVYQPDTFVSICRCEGLTSGACDRSVCQWDRIDIELDTPFIVKKITTDWRWWKFITVIPLDSCVEYRIVAYPDQWNAGRDKRTRFTVLGWTDA